jgi:hypothetical protein
MPNPLQGWYKPLPDGAAAVFVVNHGFTPLTYTLNFSLVPGMGAMCALWTAGCNVTDVWAQAPGPSYAHSFTWSDMGSHDSGFLVLQSNTPKPALEG